MSKNTFTVVETVTGEQVMTTLNTHKARAGQDGPVVTRVMATRVMVIGSGLVAVALLGFLVYFE